MEFQAEAKLLLLLLWAIHCGHAYIRVERYASIIDVTNGGTWGDWTWPEMCPDGYFASGFSIKVKVQYWVLKDRDIGWIAELRMAIATEPHFCSLPHPGGAPSRHSWR